ncbi:MAG: hypothetical protein LBQ22_12980 [Bacteroidales bacterium]|jgi:hypothetical protein|nr:hypothetical protein [Bacteroidales bacterium]
MNYFLIDKQLSELNYRLYSIVYNQNKESKYRLKKQHEQYFEKLLKQANGQLYERNKAGKTVNEAVLYTNSEHLGKVLGCSARTIRNYNTRLIEAGIVVKKYHGHTHDYELIFNEFLVPLKDRNDINGHWLAYDKEPKAISFARYIQNEYMRKDIPSLKELQVHYNNQLIEKEDVNNQNSEQKLTLEALNKKYSQTYVYSIKDYLRLISDFGYLNAKIDIANDVATGNKDRAKPLEKADEKKDIPPAKIPVPASPQQKILKKIKSEHMLTVLKTSCLEELKYVFAYILFAYSIDKIPNWKNTVYPKVVENTVLYIAENYFAEFKTKSELDKASVTYQKTIDISSRIIRKKLYSGQWQNYWVFPQTFFSLEYKNGFLKAYQLQKEKQTEKQKSHLNKQRVEVNDRLNEILKEYFANPHKTNYKKLLEKVRNTIPCREEQFKHCIENNIQKVENYYSKTA